MSNLSIKSIAGKLKTKLARSHLLFILLSSIISLFIMCIIYPDQFFRHNISFIRFADVNFIYGAVFTFLSNIYSGDIIQLWNNYDQMPLAFYHLSGGFYTLSNLFTSFCYLILSPVFSSEGEGFHVTFSIFYFFSNIILINIGIYILLSRFTKNKYMLLLSSVIGNTILSSQMYLGLNCASLYSFYFLLAHFIIKFFETLELRYLLYALLTFSIAVSLDPMVGIGYFYLAVHFTIISGLIWELIFNRNKLIYVLKDLKYNILNRQSNVRFIMFGMLCLVIILPTLMMFKLNYHDYDFVAEKSRMANIFSVSAYFNMPSPQHALQREWISRWVDFSSNRWQDSWLFMGLTTLFLAFIGILFSKDNRKYIFALSGLFVFLINSRRIDHPILVLNWAAHLINVFTNPFHFITRSFHMTSFLFPYIILPLVTLGIISIYETAKKNEILDMRKVLVFFYLLIAGLLQIIYANPGYSRLVMAYLISGYILIGIFFFIFLSDKIRFVNKKVAAISIFFLFFVSDLCLLSKYYIKNVSDQNLILDYRISGLEAIGPVHLEYQNPKILPFRYHYRNVPVGNPNEYLLDDPINNLGLFYRYTNLNKYFEPPSNYKPRHKSYTPLAFNPLLKSYIERDSRMFYHADYAIKTDEKVFSDILKRNLDRNIVMIDDKPDGHYKFLEHLPPDSVKFTGHRDESKYEEIIFDLKSGKILHDRERNIVTVTFKIPEKFPSFITSTVYTYDNSLLKVKLDSTALKPSQGKLIRPFTYDLQNYQSGNLNLSIPMDFSSSAESKVVMEYPAKGYNGVTAVWRNQPDNLGIDYYSLKDGWFVLHYPFDEKWKITVDDNPVKIYKANYSFIAFPLSKGTHKIYIQYWPDTWLREIIMVSLVLTIMAFCYIVNASLKSTDSLN